ncbi:MAG: sigma-70 family RNA polymerase sigma factor, partial [Lachnospiraceae bacterium]|nr:sigma-70 family RNA polymerase sigma factor [Lachnospiraceae bacterium]
MTQTTLTFEAMYEDYYDRIYKYARTLLLSKEDAEDVTEETFIAAYQHFDAYDEKKSSPATWLVRIAHNKAVNLMRSAEYAKRAEL